MMVNSSARFLLRAFTVSVALLGAVPVLSGAAQAEIARHCKGYLGARILGGVDQNGKTFTQHSHKALSGVVLEGKGVCRNRLKANDCRRQARDLIVRCGRELWARRWERRLPGTCVITSGSSRPYGGVKSWGSLSIPAAVRNRLRNDIKRAVEHSACCVLYPKARQLNFAVYLSVQGDSGCSHNSTLERLYKADCTKLRQGGLCGAPRRKRP